MTLIAWERSGISDMSWLHIPMKERRKGTSYGCWKSLMVATLLAVGWTPVESTMWLANLTDCSTSSFLLMVIPWRQQRLRTERIWQ